MILKDKFDFLSFYKSNHLTLMLANNKTLAGQLYSKFKELFPISII